MTKHKCKIRLFVNYKSISVNIMATDINNCYFRKKCTHAFDICFRLSKLITSISELFFICPKAFLIVTHLLKIILQQKMLAAIRRMV